MSSERHRQILAAIGLAWIFAVMVSYYAYNVAYYKEKVSVFARFLVSSR